MSDWGINAGYLGKNKISSLRSGVRSVKKHYLDRKNGDLLFTAPNVLEYPRLTISGSQFYYKFEETSGIRFDSGPNASDLSVVNSPSYTTGKIGNCATFTNSGNPKLSRADSLNLRFNQDESIIMWVYLTAKTGAATRAFCGKWNTGGEYIISYEGGTDRFRLYLSNGSMALPANTFGSPSTSTWYFICCIRSGTTAKISVNGGGFDTGTSSGYPTGSFRNFTVGGLDENGYSVDGYVDQLIKWPFVMTDAEIAYMYNSGAGRELSI